MFTIDVRAVIYQNKVLLKTLISPQKKYSDRYITSATVLLNKLVINKIEMTKSMAESPYFSVHFKGFVNDKYEVVCIDNHSEIYRKKGVIRK